MTASWPPSTPPSAESSDLRDYMRPIWAHKLLILTLVVVATVGTYIHFDRKPRVYQSQALVYVGEPTGVASAATNERTLANQARLLQTPEVAERVAKKIDFQGNPRALLGGVSVTASEGTDFVSVTGTAAEGAAAAQLANAFAQAFIDLRTSERNKQTDELLRSLRQRFKAASGVEGASLRRSLQDEMNQAELQRSSEVAKTRLIEQALPSGLPTSPRPRRSALFAFALSLLLGILAAFGIERIDRRMRSTDEAGRVYGLPVIATIRDDRELAAKNRSTISVAPEVRETFRSLRSNIELAAGQGALKTVLVTSAMAEEGKSTVVRNLALVYAEAGLKVALVEADLRRPSLPRKLNVAGEPGLTDVLMGLASLGEVLQEVPAELPAAQPSMERAETATHAGATAGGALPASNGRGDPEEASGRLYVITSGHKPPDPPAMFAAPSMQALLERLAANHDVVLIDSPPLLPVSDAIPLLSLADGIVLVCRLGVSTVDSAQRLLNLTARVPDARMLGLVVNGVEGGFGDSYASY